MTNDEALKILTKERVKRRNASDGYPTRYAEALGMAIKTLEQTRWIPVSERLPRDSGYYLTTTMYDEVYCDYWEGECFDRTEAVIAWMPLPERYKAESEE